VRWTVEDVPAGDRSVLHTAAAGHGTVWAFGIGVAEPAFSTLVFRRVDAGWRRVDVPSIGRANRAVVLSPDEVWVVGDGTSLHGVGDRWHEVPVADEKGQLFGLVAFGSTLWAAGFVPHEHGGSGTVQRWHGGRWVGQALPEVAPSWGLAGLGGVAEDDLWAVGQVHGPDGPPLALHRTGTGWTVLRVPLPGPGSGELADVLAVASDDVWACGYWRPAGERGRFPLLAHWDGVAWSSVAAPDGSGQLQQIVHVAGRHHGVGHRTAGGRLGPLVVRQDDDGWRDVPGPVVGGGSLHGAVPLPAGGWLVVGGVNDSPTEVRPYAAVLTPDT
jgi:hypothetical protein